MKFNNFLKTITVGLFKIVRTESIEFVNFIKEKKVK